MSGSTRPQSEVDTRKLSEVARHVVVPSGIEMTGWPPVYKRIREFGDVFDQWQCDVGSLVLGKRANGEHAATVGGVLGALAGTALLPVIGSLVGAFAGAFAASYGAEYFVTGNRQQPGKVARSVFFAQVAAMVVKTAVAIAMVVTIIGHMVWG